MKVKRVKKSIEKLAKIVEKLDQAKYVLCLYVTGMTPKSTLAIDNVQKLCEKYLEGFYELKIIDIYQHPKLAKEEQIIATPTLIKQFPLPIRRLIGDMSDTERLLAGIDLRPKAEDRRQEPEVRRQKSE
jgi:circadian clock protein KaiB